MPCAKKRGLSDQIICGFWSFQFASRFFIRLLGGLALRDLQTSGLYVYIRNSVVLSSIYYKSKIAFMYSEWIGWGISSCRVEFSTSNSNVVHIYVVHDLHWFLWRCVIVLLDTRPDALVRMSDVTGRWSNSWIFGVNTNKISKLIMHYSIWCH